MEGFTEGAVVVDLAVFEEEKSIGTDCHKSDRKKK